MRFIMKHMSKRTISVILALMVLLSSVAVAFSALANLANDPYVVALEKPAIPMQVGKTLDLSSVEVEFSEGVTVPADQITWSTEEEAILLDTNSGYLTTFAQGVYALTATKTGTTESKTVYALVNLDGAATYTIYDYTFSAADINAEGNDFKADSEWDLVPSTTLANGSFVVNGQGLTAGNNHVTFVLKPLSASGQIVSAFKDITVDAELAFPALFGQYGANFTLGVRAQFANNTPAYSATSYVGGGYRVALTTQTSNAGHKDYAITYVNGSSKKVEFTEANNSTGYRTYTVKAIGNTVELYRNGVKADLPMTDAQKTAIENTQPGTIFLNSSNTVRASVKRITAKIEFTAEELANISYTDYYYIASQRKPAIPVKMNSKLVLDRVVVEFADGTFKLGSDVVWENNNASIVYEKATNSFSIYANGLFTVKAKKDAADDGVEIYLITSNTNGLYTIYDHAFKADQINETGTDFKEDSEWDLVPSSSLANGQFVASTDGVTAGNNSVSYVLKPSSASGKLVSSFRDVTVSAEIAFPVLFGQYGASFLLGARAQFANNTPAYSATSYVGGGYRVALTTQTSNAGHKDYAITYVNGSSKKVEFTEANNSTGYRTYTVKAIGNTVELYRNGVKADLPMTDAQKTAIGDTQKGTIYLESTSSVRAAIRRISVSIEFTAEELAIIEESYIQSDYYLVEADKPALPIQIAKTLNLNDVVVQFSDDLVLLGSQIKWTSEGGLLIDGSNCLTAMNIGNYKLIATSIADPSMTKEIYLYAREELTNDIVIYEHVFGTDDVKHPESITSDTASPLYGYTVSAYNNNSAGLSKVENLWVSNPNSDWALFNSYGQSWIGNTVTITQDPNGNALATPFNYTYNEETITAGNAWMVNGKAAWGNYTFSGISIGTNRGGWIYLRPDSEFGKTISQFADYTIDYTFDTADINNDSTFYLLGKYSGNKLSYVNGSSAAFNLANETYLGVAFPCRAKANGDATGAAIAYSTEIGTGTEKSWKAGYSLSGMDRHVKYNVKMAFNKNEVTLSYKPAKSDTYTQMFKHAVDASVADLKGTIAIQCSEQVRPNSTDIKVSITFTDEELAKIEKAYVENDYFFVTQNKPAIPVTRGYKYYLDNVAVGFADGAYMLGSDVIWESNDGTVVYNESDNSFDVYTRTMVTVKAKKNAADEGTDIYLVPRDDNGLYTIYDYTFTADDLKPITGHSNGKYINYEPNSNYWWGTWMATYAGINGRYTENESSDWGLRNISSAAHFGKTQDIFEIRDGQANPAYPKKQASYRDCTYWLTGESAVVTAEDVTANSAWVFESGKGIGIATNQPAWIYLKPESDAGKLVGRFSDYTIRYTYVTSANAGTAINVLGRFSGKTIDYETGKDIFRLGEETYLGSTVPHGAKQHTAYSMLYSKNVSKSITGATYSTAANKEYTAEVKLKGNSVTVSVKELNETGFTQLYTATPDVDTSTLTGTIAIQNHENTRHKSKAVAVSLDYTTEDLGRLKIASLGECYDEGSRLIYMQANQTLELSKVNFEYNGRYYNGTALTFTAPSVFTVVNGVSITAATEGVYTVTANTGSGTFNITVAVSAEGALFDNGNYTFTYNFGALVDLNRTNAAQPYSQHIKFPATHADGNVYDIATGFAAKSEGVKEVVSVEIEKYIEKIGGNAFYGFAKLKTVIIANTVTEIGEGAFGATTALKEIVIPGSVEKIGTNAFAGGALERIIISNKDAVIENNAFPTGTTIVGFAGSTAAKYASDNGYTFVELSGAEKAAAEASYNEWITFKTERLTKVNDVEWIVHKANNYGDITYTINGFKVTDRTAGKFIVPATVEVVEGGVTKTVKIEGIRNGENQTSPFYTADGRAIYTLEFEEGVTYIGFQGFKNCYNIQSVTFPSSMSTIGWESFAGTALTTVEIPDTIRNIGPKAFNNCVNLTEIKISENSMLHAYGTHSVSLNYSPESICTNTKVTKMVLPVLVERITTSCFNYTTVKELWIYNSQLQFIDTFTTDNRDGWVLPTDIVIYGVKGSTAEEYAKKWGNEFHEIPDFYQQKEGVLDTTAKFTAKFNGSTYAITGFIGIGGKVIMPSTFNVGGVVNAPVTTITSSSFQYEDVATNGIDRIINLEIAEGYVSIGENAFKGTNRLKSIKFPSTLRSIGKMAFSSSGLEGALEIPKAVTQIGAGAFRGVSGLTDVYIYNPIATIGATAFDATITIHGVKGSTAEEYALANNIKFVEITSSKATAADFSDNGNYTFTVNEEGIITGYERKDNTKPYSLKVTIPATVNGVAVKGVAEGTFEDGAEKASVYALVISEGITEIGKNAFSGLANLSYLNIPKSLKTIGEAAFAGTNLTGDLVLHEGLETIEREAFKDCVDIDSVTAESKTVVLKANALPRGSQKTVLYGYTGSTAEQYSKSFALPITYLDGGPVTDTEDPSDTDKDEENDYTDDPIDAPEDDGEEGNNIVTIIRQSDMTMVIIIAVSILMLVLLLAVAVVVVVVVKTKKDSIY